MLESVFGILRRVSGRTEAIIPIISVHAETYMRDVVHESKASQQRTTEERTTVVRRRSLDERANFCCS
jgi:hypothetical protein